MDRRKLLKILPLVAIPLSLKEGRAEGFCEEDYNGVAYKIEKGYQYIFVFNRRVVHSPEYLSESIGRLGIKGSIVLVDDPENDVCIYKADE